MDPLIGAGPPHQTNLSGIYFLDSVVAKVRYKRDTEMSRLVPALIRIWQHDYDGQV